MQFLIVLVILSAVVLVVLWPLMRAGGHGGEDQAGAARARAAAEAERDLAELEAEREAKYREIRDAELDHRTGKLSDEDYAAVDQVLRAQAVEIMRALDSAHDDSVGREPSATIEAR